MNASNLSRNVAVGKRTPLTVNDSPLKTSCLPKMSAISGVIKAEEKDETTAVKAVPITTATARSTTLPRRRKARNPLNITLLLLRRHGKHDFTELLRGVQSSERRLY